LLDNMTYGLQGMKLFLTSVDLKHFCKFYLEAMLIDTILVG